MPDPAAVRALNGLTDHPEACAGSSTRRRSWAIRSVIMALGMPLWSLIISKSSASIDRFVRSSLATAGRGTNRTHETENGMTLSRTAFLTAALTLTGSAYAIGSHSQGNADLDGQSSSSLVKRFKSFEVDDTWQNQHRALVNYLAILPTRSGHMSTRTAFASDSSAVICANCHSNINGLDDL